MDYKIIDRDDLNYIKVPRLENLGVKHMYTLNKVDFKLRPPNEEEKRQSVIESCYKELDIYPKKVFTSRQVHSKNVKSIEFDKDFDRLKYWNRYNDADGMITNEKGVLLFTKYADCLPILLFDMKNKVLANVHSGWRGTVQKIGTEAIYKMKKLYGTETKNIFCVLGPAIGFKDFEVTKEVYNMFEKEFGYMKDVIKRKDDTHWIIDTRKINYDIFLNLGVLIENIVSIDISTFSNPLFHSYRRDGKNYQLMASLTYLE